MGQDQRHVDSMMQLFISNESATKRCSKCGHRKPHDDFFRQKKSKDGKHAHCKTCRMQYQNDRHVADGGISTRRRNLVWKFGFDEVEFADRLARQGGACAVCRTSDGPFAVDHDHGCCPGPKTCGKCVRSILCGNCNRAIGILKDDPALCRAAADYLEAWT